MKLPNLAALNSATKYPPIETFHKLDGRGKLTEELSFTFEGTVHLREKIHGANTRFIKLPGGDWVVGSKEHLLCAKGDRVPNGSEGIVENALTFADELSPIDGDQLHVLYLETYGGRFSQHAKQYTGSQALGHRLFDVALVPVEILDQPVEAISTWRKGGGQKFFTEATLQRFADADGLPLVPPLGTVSAESLPATLQETYDWLRGAFPMGTYAPLDEGGKGRPEGIVLRTHDRRTIAKARIEDYAKALDIQMPRP